MRACATTKPRRKRRTKEELEAERVAAQQAADQAKVVLWADTHGAPIKLLIGWDPATGQWHPTSPIGQLLALVQANNFPSTAAKAVGLTTLNQLVAKGLEYLVDAAEDRDYIPVEVRPFIDLVRELDLAESVAEADLVNKVRAGSNDPKIALALLGRRYASRWREQQQIFTGEQTDERDRAVSEALQDPNTALALAAVAHRIEDVTTNDS